MNREKFGSRLGFILISAGCAIGLGNVYRFPITTGAYGGAIFVLVYIGFLILLGIPAMTAELAVGRASQRSIASSFEVLEKPGQKWHWMKYLGIGGNYLLMMFYTVISGWMLIYFFKYLDGSILSISESAALGELFGSTVTNTPLNIIATFAIILICFGICSMGLQKGVEKITKVMMLALFALMIGLVIYAFTHGHNGDLFVQKAPAATLETLATALKEIYSKVDPKYGDTEVRVIGTRHGEKLYETLVTREEMAKAIDMGNYYRIPCDNRDLNYDKFFSEGDEVVSRIEDYHSHNTQRLDVEGMKKQLMRLRFIQEDLGLIEKAKAREIRSE